MSVRTYHTGSRSERLCDGVAQFGFARRKVDPTVMVVVAFCDGGLRRNVARCALAITQCHDRFLLSPLLRPELILHKSLGWDDQDCSRSEVDGGHLDGLASG